MKLLVFVLIVVAITSHGWAWQVDWGMCHNDPQNIRDCMFYIFDTNNDSQITWDEVEARLPTLTQPTQNAIARIANFTHPDVVEGAQAVFNYCDFVEDGVITMEDFTTENATCLQHDNNRICIHCIQNGYRTEELAYMDSVAEAKKKRLQEK